MIKLAVKVFAGEQPLGEAEFSSETPFVLMPARLGGITGGRPGSALTIHVHVQAENAILGVQDFASCTVSAYADSEASLAILRVKGVPDLCRVTQLVVKRLDAERSHLLLVGCSVEELNVGIETTFEAARSNQKIADPPLVTDLRQSSVSRARIFVPHARLDVRASEVASLTLEPAASAQLVHVWEGSAIDALTLRAKVSGVVIEVSKVDSIVFGRACVVDSFKASDSAISTAYGCDPDTFPTPSAETWLLCMQAARNQRNPKGYATAGYEFARASGQDVGGLERAGDWLLRVSCGYGYRPMRAGVLAIGVWAFCGAVFWGLTIADLGVGPAPSPQPSCLSWLGRCLYFSAITLTTVGYGDITPQHWPAMALASLEGTAGILLLALLVFSLTKKYGSN
jgi:hypothetical protein